MAFLKKFDIKQICVVNHQDINILSNFGSRKTKNREMIGSSVKDFGSFYQKTLEAIFSKDRKTTALIELVECNAFEHRTFDTIVFPKKCQDIRKYPVVPGLTLKSCSKHWVVVPFIFSHFSSL